VGAFRDALDHKQELAPPPGHPVHTYLADNRILATLGNRIAEVARHLDGGVGQAAELLPVAAAALARYDGLDNHYRRKENQLFPLLERHGVTGPSQVMWGIHDQIRTQWKQARTAVESDDVNRVAEILPALARNLIEMVYKEEKILFPMALEKLSAEEWPSAGLLPLGTGALSLEVVDLMLRHLPLDLSFVDENDVVRYYSEGKERIFPRTPAAIGRTVQNCHPPKSVATVNRILDSFRAGSKDVAEFWIEMGLRFVDIRYFAVRDSAGRYRGCLEVTQDIGPMRALTGERRLLDWQD
jgi:DUF438 domain-containing protein